MRKLSVSLLFDISNHLSYSVMNGRLICTKLLFYLFCMGVKVGLILMEEHRLRVWHLRFSWQWRFKLSSS